MYPLAAVAGRRFYFLVRRSGKMRRPHRWLVSLGVFLCVASFFFLLSALIETPASDASPVEAPHAISDAALHPAALPSPETVPQTRAAVESYLSVAALLWLMAALPLLVKGSDANGRVLRKRSYARSFYPVFKLEMACG
jgi:hypothetical protein